MKDKKSILIIKDILNTLSQKYSTFAGIYLFGSRARGHFERDSDYDFAIVFNQKVDSSLKREISDIMAIIMMQYDVIIDNLVFEYDELIHPKTPLRERIIQEGIFYGFN